MIAVVGLGGAGGCIIKMLRAKADVYFVSKENWLNCKNFYTFEQVSDLVKKISKHRHVILAAGLGSSGGELLVHLATKLSNVDSIFVAKPFKIEKERYKKAEKQLSMLKEFRVFVKELDELMKSEKFRNFKLSEALRIFDQEIAEAISKRIKELLG